MKYQIVNRLEYILDQEKMFDPQRICQILEKELSPIIRNYLEIENQIKVRYKKNNNKNMFFVEFIADRIKPVGYIPY